MGISLIAQEIINARTSREHATEICREEKRANDLESILKEGNLKIDKIKEQLKIGQDSAQLDIIELKKLIASREDVPFDYYEIVRTSDLKRFTKQCKQLNALGLLIATAIATAISILILFLFRIDYNFGFLLSVINFLLSVINSYGITVAVGLAGFGFAVLIVVMIYQESKKRRQKQEDNLRTRVITLYSKIEKITSELDELNGKRVPKNIK